MDEFALCREIISRISSHPLSPASLERLKIEVCRAHRSPVIPKNSAILAAALPGERERLRGFLLLKPTRTLSGVAPVAVMTSPAPGAPTTPSGPPRATPARSPRPSAPGSMATTRTGR